MSRFSDFCDQLSASERQRIILRCLIHGREARQPASREELLGVLELLIRHQAVEELRVITEGVVTVPRPARLNAVAR